MPKRNATPKSAGPGWHRTAYVMVRLSPAEHELLTRASTHAEQRPGVFARAAVVRAARRALRQSEEVQVDRFKQRLVGELVRERLQEATT